MGLNDFDREELQSRIELEGFEYAMRHYSTWQGIKDSWFHILLKEYKEAADELEDYINGERD